MFELKIRDKVKASYLENDDIVVVDKRCKPISNPLDPYPDSLKTVVLDCRIRGGKKETSQDYYYSPSSIAPTSIAERLRDVQPIDIKRYLEFFPFKPFVLRQEVLKERKVFGATVHSVPRAVARIRTSSLKFPTMRTETFPSCGSPNRLQNVERQYERETGLVPAWRADARSWPGRFNRAIGEESESLWSATMRNAAEAFVYYGLRENHVWETTAKTVMINGSRYYECECGDPGCDGGGIPE